MKTVACGFAKDSTLWAFEGPEEPNPLDFKWGKASREYCDLHIEWIAAMSTARESALPVVNAEEVGFLIEGSTILLNEEGLSRLKLFARPGETVALPGWALEKESHFTLLYHRLVRSEPEKPKKYEPFPQISELSEFESDKPENSAHGYTEGSEVIGNLNLGMDSMVIGSKNVEPSE